MQARRLSSLLSNACTLTSRMLIEYPCDRDRSQCLIPPRLAHCFLLCWGRRTDGSRNGFASLCGQDSSWCLSPPPFPWCLLWSLYLKNLTGQAAEPAGGESTKLRVNHFLILTSDWQSYVIIVQHHSRKHNNTRKKNMKSTNLHKLIYLSTCTWLTCRCQIRSFS